MALLQRGAAALSDSLPFVLRPSLAQIPCRWSYSSDSKDAKDDEQVAKDATAATSSEAEGKRQAREPRNGADRKQNPEGTDRVPVQAKAEGVDAHDKTVSGAQHSEKAAAGGQPEQPFKPFDKGEA